MISFAIMHAPWSSRWPFVLELLPSLPGAALILDEHRQGIWPTARRAWRAHAANALHHVVVQDDAILPSDFVAQVADLAERHPATAMTFNRTGGAPTAVANMMPVEALHRWIAWADGLPERDRAHDDLLLLEWCRRVGMPLHSHDFVGHRPIPSIRREERNA